MSAIITEQLRILNASNFASGIKTTSDSYYLFVGLPNATTIQSDWNSNPPAPIDSFDEESKYWESMIALKKIDTTDVRKVVRKLTWTSGTTYELYRHDYSRNNLSRQTNSSNLYEANYYIINRDYRVYICLQNGTTPETPNGKPSLDEPTFTDLEPRSAGSSGDGYIWKYLFTINPSDIVKFDTTNYVPVPDNWSTNSEVSAIRENSVTSTQIKTVLIVNRGTGYTAGLYSNVEISGDGTGGKVSVTVDSSGKVSSIEVTNGGSNYTFGTINLDKAGIINSPSSIDSEFFVIIPPKGGHGYDIYRELGTKRVLIYSKLQNDDTNPDFITGNEFARIGIVKNPQSYNSNSILTEDKVSSVYALRLSGANLNSTTFTYDGVITQTVGTGITAAGKVLSWNSTTGVLKYWQDRFISTSVYGPEVYEFTNSPITGGSLTINGGSSSLSISTSFTGITTVINNKKYYLGQQFNNGISNPEVKKYSGEVIYIDNRPSITRSVNQREDIKIILEF
jgi:hypothetical protein